MEFVLIRQPETGHVISVTAETAEALGLEVIRPVMGPTAPKFDAGLTRRRRRDPEPEPPATVADTEEGDES